MPEYATAAHAQDLISCGYTIFRGYCPDAARSLAPDFDRRVHTDVWDTFSIGSLIDPYLQYLNPVGVQLATRGPNEPYRTVKGHIDGRYYPGNGVPEGTLCPFACLVGLFVTDCPHDASGGLVVWPGSHTANAQQLTIDGPESLIDKEPDIGPRPSTELHLWAGDVVVLHYLTRHGPAPNMRRVPRHALYWRPKAPTEDMWGPLTDLWKYWKIGDDC